MNVETLNYTYDFAKTCEEWTHPPAEGCEFLTSANILQMSNEQILMIVNIIEQERYCGWRNYKGLWRGLLGLDDTVGKHILDFGCGLGIESLQFARSGNKVSIADIVSVNLDAAERILSVCGHKIENKILVTRTYPFFEWDALPIDIFYANGVLHHTPMIREILGRANEVLNENGEVRLLLYSDIAWCIMTGEDPDRTIPVHLHPLFMKFVRAMDQYGVYADWYDLEKLQDVVKGMFRVKSFQYMTNTGQYCVAVLKRLK